MSPVHGDWSLSRRILNGDERAFRALFDAVFPRLYRFARARLGGDGEQAREVVQLTVCRAFERLGTYRGECSLYGWFCQICRNAIADTGRIRLRELGQWSGTHDDDTIEELLESLSGPQDEEPEQRLWQAQLVCFVHGALDSLPVAYSDVLEWKYLDGLSVKEIAARLEVGPKAAESLLTRARRAFRDAIRMIGGAMDVLARPSREET